MGGKFDALGTDGGTDQFGAKGGAKDKAYPTNIGAGTAGTAGATGDAPPPGDGDRIASGGEEVAAGKAGSDAGAG